MTAVRIRHRGVIYRLLRLTQSSDWSLMIVWDRQSPDDAQNYRFSSDEPIPVAEAPSGDQKRLTYHPTGQVNYHGWVRTGPRYHEALQAITQPQLLIIVSVAAITKLTALKSVGSDDVIVDIEDQVGEERFTFGIVAAPLAYESPPNALFCLKYDVFSIVCVTMPPPDIPLGLEQHNIYCAPEGRLSSRAINDPDRAMLAYHQARIGHTELGIYPPNGDGVYHLLPRVIMRAIPQVTISFSEPGYRIEVVHERARPMLIPFRIFQGNKRIVRGDLRELIASIELSAEL